MLGTANSVQVLGRVLVSGGGGGSTSVVLFGAEQHNTAVMDVNGTQTVNPHVVTGSASITNPAASVAVSFSGAATFAGNASFFCTANDTTNPAAVQINYNNGGNGFTLVLPAAPAVSDTIRFQCTGN